MERLIRYSKKVTLAIVMTFVVAVTGILSTSFQSRASFYEFYMPYGQPTTSENSGYLEVLVRAPDGNISCDVFYWNITADNSTSVTSMDFSLYGNGRLNFSPSVPSLNDGFSYTLMYIGSTGNVSYMHGGYFTGYASYTYDVSTYGYTFLSYRVYGNYGSVFDDVAKPMPQFSCIYGADKFELEKLSDIYNQLVVANSNDLQMIDKLNSIMNSNSSIDSKLSQLIELQNTTNTWLEKIWNSIQEFFNPSNEEKADSEQFDSETTEKSDEIGGLVEESKTDKPDVDEMSNSIDSNLDMTSANEYGAVLLNITENEYILQMLLIVVTVAIIAYVLFGKR